MGMALVREAMAPHWSALTPFARLVLVHMATTALDRPNQDGDDARLYFAGHGPICLFVAGVGEDEGAAYDSALRRVRRAVRELLDAGAIAQVRRSVNGRRAVYELTTSSIPLPVDNYLDDEGAAGPKGQASRTPVSY